MSDESSNTAQEQRIPGKPFTKGDVRINRKGRPKSFDKLRAFSVELLSEPAIGADGKPIVIDGHVATNLEMILRSWLKNPKLQQALLEIAFGKVTQDVDVKSGGKPLDNTIRVITHGDDSNGA